MDGIFDSIFIPNKFFKKKQSTYLSSILAFIAIFFVNLIAFPETVGRIFGFLGLKAVIIFIIAFPILYFINFGIDLLFITSDKNNWTKTHYGHTFSPYLFLPFPILFIMNSNLHIKIAGFALLIVLIAWSSILFSKLSVGFKTLLLRILKDILIIYFWINLVI